MNYAYYAKSYKWKELSSGDAEYLEEHQWPPVHYKNELSAYEAKMKEVGAAGKGSTQCCMIM